MSILSEMWPSAVRPQLDSPGMLFAKRSSQLAGLIFRPVNVFSNLKKMGHIVHSANRQPLFMNIFASVIVTAFSTASVIAQLTNSMPVSAPVTTEVAGKAGPIAVQSVFRIVDIETRNCGTGFLHKSGKILTAAHVVSNRCDTLRILLPTGALVEVKGVTRSDELDFAIVTPATEISGPALPLASEPEIAVGTQVATWGFPAGYCGGAPLLTVGYIAGADVDPTTRSPRFVVNAAFNGGNSGGPVIRLDDNAVLAVVSSKLAPVPPHILNYLDALKGQRFGMTFIATKPDGSKTTMSEGQVIAEVLVYLRSQTQLVIGHAVPCWEINSFLKKNGIEP